MSNRFTSVAERNAEIVRLAREERVRPADIADLVGCSRGLVYQTISVARQEGLDIPHFGTGGRPADRRRPLGVRVDIATMNDLREEAIQRGMSVGVFAGCLLDTIARDGLFDAVMDDGGDEG